MLLLFLKPNNKDTCFYRGFVGVPKPTCPYGTLVVNLMRNVKSKLHTIFWSPEQSSGRVRSGSGVVRWCDSAG